MVQNFRGVNVLNFKTLEQPIVWLRKDLENNG